LSVIYGEGEYKGYLLFDVLENKEEDTNKLMTVYSRKYNAKRRRATTTMVIADEDGERLVAKYLI
jgi:C4-type Zn-finger protein